MVRVELDKKALFALASDTRVEILHALQPMRRTVTQLADELGIDKAAVHRHLQKLVEGGLAQRFEDHGFVYYGLSWKTRDILDPNDNTRIVLLLASSVALVMVAVAAILAAASPLFGVVQDFPSIYPPITEPGSDTLGLFDESSTMTDAGPGGVTRGLEAGPYGYAWLGMGTVLALLSLPLLLRAWRLHRPPKQRVGGGATTE